MHDLNIWTVYDHPSDYPDCFVARRHTVKAGVTNDLVTGDSIDEVRAKIKERSPYLLEQVARHPDDDKSIMETWV